MIELTFLGTSNGRISQETLTQQIATEFKIKLLDDGREEKFDELIKAKGIQPNEVVVYFKKGFGIVLFFNESVPTEWMEALAQINTIEDPTSDISMKTYVLGSFDLKSAKGYVKKYSRGYLSTHITKYSDILKFPVFPSDFPPAETSGSLENKLQEVYISNPNNTNLSDTEMNDNKSNPIISVDEKRFDSDNRSEDYQAYENLVKETIDYESLEVTHHDDMRQVDEIVNLIVETVMCKNDKILIASNWYPASLVKKKFLMLTYSHIEYVLHCMSGNTTKVKNIKKYLLAALFNAPSTMNGYYQAEVNHDMPGLVR